ncbi:MAG: response regulator transcription factor [Myxococcales bacterium]|nr:response regulator transcription factor [Myxococcales bacterium]
MSGTILLVDDEQDLIETLRYALEREGYSTLAARNGAAAMGFLGQTRVPDLVLLDWMLPDMAGTEVCRQLRTGERTRGIPVIMISARGEEIDRVVGFEIGADDYVTKPFSVRELLLRIKAILRRRHNDAANDSEAQWGNLRVDFEGHQVWVDDQRVTLTALEFRLLTTLLTRRGRVQTREMLLSDVWSVQVDVTTRTVDTHVQRLRKKLGVAGQYIETLRGVGYRFLVGAPGTASV